MFSNPNALILPIISLIIFCVVAVAGLFARKGVKTVPQGENWVIQRLGAYHKTLEPGLRFINPILDIVFAEVGIKDMVLDIAPQEVITKDNVSLTANAAAYIRILHPHKAVYAVEDYKESISTLVQTTLRSIIGEMDFDSVLSHREQMKTKLKAMIAEDILNWGITLNTVEIQDINPSASMKASMEKQAAAERERRATVTRAEGQKQAQLLEAEGKLEASRLIAESQKVLARGTEASISSIASAVGENESPIVYLLGEQYIKAMRDMAESDNAKTVVLPSDILNTVKGLTGGKGGDKG